MKIIAHSVRKKALFAMRYRLRKPLISCFKAKIVPINKIVIQEIYQIIYLIKAICIINKREDFW